MRVIFFYFYIKNIININFICEIIPLRRIFPQDRGYNLYSYVRITIRGYFHLWISQSMDPSNCKPLPRENNWLWSNAIWGKNLKFESRGQISITEKKKLYRARIGNMKHVVQ